MLESCYFSDTIPNITSYRIDESTIADKAYFIWKRYGNGDAVLFLFYFYVAVKLLLGGEGDSDGESIERCF